MEGWRDARLGRWGANTVKNNKMGEERLECFCLQSSGPVHFKVGAAEKWNEENQNANKRTKFFGVCMFSLCLRWFSPRVHVAL